LGHFQSLFGSLNIIIRHLLLPSPIALVLRNEVLEYADVVATGCTLVSSSVIGSLGTEDRVHHQLMPMELRVLRLLMAYCASV
jgi:hypothetical protein